MKQFVKYLLIFVAPLLVLTLVAEIMLRRIPNEYQYKKSYLDQHSNELEVLYMGSSHVFYGIDPKVSRFRGFNAAHSGQTLNFDLAILKKYSGKFKNLKCIVLPIDYFTMHTLLDKGERTHDVRNYNIYYGIRQYGTLSNNSEMLTVKLSTNLKRLYEAYVKHENTVNCTKLGWGWVAPESAAVKPDLYRSAKAIVKRHTAADDRYLAGNMVSLQGIIDFARESNVKVFLFTTPAYKSYLQLLKESQLSVTLSVADSMATANKRNVVYYNMLRDSSYVASDFYDADHFEQRGAKKFTLVMDSLLSATLAKK